MAATMTERALGLTEAEAAQRLSAAGRPERPASSRSYATIVRANVFTVFNLILLVAGVATLAFGAWQDALFLGVLVSNSAIGIAQEVRAKRALDQLAALVAPTARVVREGRSRELPVEQVAQGDLVQLGAGDQVVADGLVVESNGLSLDESILTGESEPVEREAGEEVRSGSFAAEGVGTFEVSAVGAQSYAARVTGEARSFRHPRSPLERALNRLLFSLVAVMVPLGILLGLALWERDTPLSTAVPTSVAAVVTMVPEGLILLASLTYAVAAIQLARRGALAQQLNAIESIASVDVVCLDKTGTLTEPRLTVTSLLPAPAVPETSLKAALGRFAASAPGANATLEAIKEHVRAPAEHPEAIVPFSSRRRWSALRVAGENYVLGAPELFALGPLEPVAEEHVRSGRRVVAFGATSAELGEPGPDDPPPGELRLLGLVVLSERLRPGIRQTVGFFRSQGVELKVISGDRPQTAAAIAADAGLDVAGDPLDGSRLPSDSTALARLAGEATVIGRIDPEGKRRVVESLRDSGRYVAMVGDGVNDVPALKAARLAIAQGSGTQMARAVADIVLVRDDFGAVPDLVAQGRRIFRNLRRVAKLFITKSAFAVFLILSIGLTPMAYPLLPRHLTLAASLTIGIPAFFLALAPSSGSFRTEGFLTEVARFAAPAGTAVGFGVLSSYLFALNVLDLKVIEARTVATTVLVVAGLYLILVLEASSRLREAAVGALCLALAVVYALVLLFPPTRDFFALAAPTPAIVLTAAVGALLPPAALWLTDERFTLHARLR
jgi:cation-transporting ATPase E